MASASKLANLQTALDKTRAAPAAVPDRRTTVEATPATPKARRQANRQGKVNVAAWMHPDFKRSMRLVQARRSCTIQDLLEEALNDLFAKYDVPQVFPPKDEEN
jgi:hypothetical protein